MMKELAPQSKDGAYERPSYQFNSGSLSQKLQVSLHRTVLGRAVSEEH